jgi:hypothetical protein
VKTSTKASVASANLALESFSELTVDIIAVIRID